MEKGHWAEYDYPSLFSVDLVAARFGRLAIFENSEPLSYMWKTNFKLINCDVSHFGNWW